MHVEVIETPLAEQQASALRSRHSRTYQQFLDDLQARGCAVLGYRLTGEKPLDHLCVKHLVGNLRAVVAFESASRAYILLVGPHANDDPGIDVYQMLYRLAGVSPPDSLRRTKPTCCDPDGIAPYVTDQVNELVDRAAKLRRTRR